MRSPSIQHLSKLIWALALAPLLPAHADLIGLYTFDEADLTQDSSGEGNDLTSEGVDPTADANGFEGGAALFDGFQRFTAPISVDTAALPMATMGAWVRTDTIEPALRKVLGGDDGGWDRTIGLDNRNGAFRYTSFTGTGPLPGTPGPTNTEDWAFIAASYDETAQTMTVYVDTDASTTDDIPVAVRSSSAFGPGATTVSVGSVGPGTDGEGWMGSMDNVFFFNEALDAGQIRLIRDGGVAGLTGELPMTDPVIAVTAPDPLGTLANQPGSQQRSVMVTNSGATQRLTISGATFSGPQMAHFAVLSTPEGLDPGASGEIVIAFDPGTASGDFDATLEITSDDFGAPVSTIAFTAKVAGGLIAENLLGFYTFDDPDNPLQDNSGRENHLTLPGDGADPVYGETTGVQGGAYTFDGQTRLIGSLNLNPDAVPELTVGAWVKAATLDPGLRKVIGTDNGGWDRTIGLDNREGDFRYTTFIGNGPPLAGTPGPESTDAWTFLAVTFDQPNNEVTVYVDTDVASLNDEMIVVSGATGFTDGFEQFAVGSLRIDNANEGWQGEIDNLFVVPTVLGGEQLDAFRAGGRSAIENYGFGPPRESLVAFYHFDDPEKSLEDSSGNANTLDPVSPPTYVPSGGFQGGAYDFDGNQRFVADIDINIDQMPQLTVGAWVKPSNLTSGLKKVLGSDDGGWDRTIGLDNREDDFRYTAFVGNQRPVVGTPGPENTEDWTFFAAVFDETTAEVTVYVDVNAGTTGDPLISVTEPTAFGAGPPQISIGSLRPDNNSEGWQGLLDNVFLYDAALTETQLAYLRNGGSPVILGVTGDDPNLDFDLTPLFGALVDRAPVTRTLEISNTGRTETLMVTGVSVIGRDASHYTVTGFPEALAPGASGQVTITFDPLHQVGDFTAQLQIASNDESLQLSTVNLGASTAAPTENDPVIGLPVISPFGVLEPGTYTRTVTIRNDGSSQPLTISRISVSGNDAAAYTLGDLPGPIAPGASGSLEITFDSGGEFGRFQATLDIVSDHARGRFASTSIEANVPITDPLTALIGFYSFDDASNTLKDDSESGNDLMFAEDIEPVHVPGGGFEGGGAYEFDGSQRLIAPIDINVGTTPELTMGAWVKPSSIDPGLRKILGHDNGGWDRTIGLDNREGNMRYLGFTGQGVMSDTPEPTNTEDWTFIAVAYDEPSQEVTLYVDLNASTFEDALLVNTQPTVFNLGFDTVSIGSLRPDTSAEGWAGLIDKVFFFDAVLDAATIEEIREGGILPGSQDPNLRVTGGFGDLGNNVNPVTRTLTVRNGGRDQTLTITDSRLTGPNADRFTLLDELPASLAPGASATVEVRLDPGGEQGGFIAFLEIDSNDAGDPTLAIDLSAIVSNGNGLLAHYRLDETSGTTLLDASGFGHHGTYESVNGGSFTLGADALASGAAVSFDDANDSGAAYGLVPAGAAPGPLSPFSIAMWVNQAADDAGVSTLFAKGSGPGDPFAVASLEGALVWFSNAEQGLILEGAMSRGEPHHLVTTYAAENDSAMVTFYLNGEDIGSAEVAAFDDASPSIFQIGALNGQFGFKGLIDDVQVYNKVLTADEIASLLASPGMVLAGEPPIVVDPEPAIFSVADVTKNDGTMSLTFQSQAGVSYVLEYSETLEGDWTVIQTIDGQDGTTSAVDTDATRLAKAIGFYRVRSN